MTVYGPRCNVHPDRIGATRTGPYRLLVVHTSEGGEGPTSAENLCAFMATVGDRSNPDGTKFGASYHYVTDLFRVLPAVPDNVVAYSAAGANNDGIHFCIPGKAAQSRDQWLDFTSREYIRQLAAAMVDKAREHKIPLRPLPVVEIVKGEAGYCGHVDISHAYHRSDHTDPGPSFPWDVLADDIAALTEPEEPPVAVRYFNLNDDKPNTLWATSDGLIAVRLEGDQVIARADVPAVIPILSESEGRKMSFIVGLPWLSVR